MALIRLLLMLQGLEGEHPLVERQLPVEHPLEEPLKVEPLLEERPLVEHPLVEHPLVEHPLVEHPLEEPLLPVEPLLLVKPLLEEHPLEEHPLEEPLLPEAPLLPVEPLLLVETGTQVVPPPVEVGVNCPSLRNNSKRQSPQTTFPHLPL